MNNVTYRYIMASLKEVGEKNIIQNILNIIRPCSQLGPGDDAAIASADDGKVVICTDVVTFDRHFPKGMTYEHFGWTAAAVNFSDIASMGAKPTGFLAALALPEDMDENDLYDIMSGIDQCAEFCGTTILGGDTKFGPGLIAGTAIGSLEGRKPLTRSGAKPGDVIAVTGCLGAAAAGFFAIENDISDKDSIFSLMVPIPRVEEGLALSKSNAVTACMDLSDGLAEAAKSICKASHVGMDIQMDFIPEGEGVKDICKILDMDKKDLTLYWGGDYELLFTFKKEQIDSLYKAGLVFSIIGIVTNDDCPYIIEGNERTRMKDGRY
ncbi:MAG: thiamine-phosphate kinase [Candidatus Methanomethylophilaceae archaeon]|nr:thiamine-phosphate kinase [Candidatus Methanomethylophilaceae archaeon]